MLIIKLCSSLNLLCGLYFCLFWIHKIPQFL